MRRAVRALSVLSLLIAGCSGGAPPPPAVEADEARLADAALQGGDYARAASLYRLALAKAPDRFALHYGLGVAATHLDLTAEAIRELSWVVQHGDPALPETDSARRWLTSVGALPRPAKRHSSTPPAEMSAASTARVEGRVAPVGAKPGAVTRVQLFLVEQPSRVHHYPVRTDEEGRFQFPAVAPGIYKLSDRISGPPTWRLRVEVKPGQVVFVDLGANNTTRSRDDFPDHH
jgi:hypothetical protein